MKKIFAILFIPLIALSMAGCKMLNVGAGIEGAFINDALPEGAFILKAEFPDKNETHDTAGTEGDFTAAFEWNTYKETVSCTAIKGVQLWTSGIDEGEMGLLLVNHKYGGRYYPYPPSDSFWYDPMLWVEKEPGNITVAEAEKLAAHCGVEFRTRR